MKKIIWILAIAAMVAISCAKWGGDTPKDNGQESTTCLKINSVSTVQPDEATGLTKAAIKGTSFPVDQEASIGLFVVGDGYSDAKYNNIKCTKSAGSEKFTYPEIKLIEGKTATVYAYYPYDGSINTVEKLKSIEVSSSMDGKDWMWATPVEGVSVDNPEIDLEFNHALALVEIIFEIFGGQESAMTNIKISGGANVSNDMGFWRNGKLNAQNGDISNRTDTNHVHMSSPFSQDVNLMPTNHSIAVDFLLVSGKRPDLDRQVFYVGCTLGSEEYGVELSADKGGNGVKLLAGVKSTIHLNVKVNEGKMDVESVTVDDWDRSVVGNTATIDGHKVTFNFDKASGLNPSISFCKSSSAITMDDSEDMPENTLVSKVVFKYDPTVITDEKFISCESGAGCNCVLDKNDHTITVTDVTQDVTVNVTVGNSTRIFYTAKSKVEPYDKTAMGVPFDAERSTFSNGNGVMYFDGIVTTIGADAFKEYSLSEQNKRLTGITIPESVTSIGLRAFQSCTILETVSLPDGLTTIGDEAFEYCYKLKPQLPASLETMGQMAFNICKEMTSIDLSNCTKLKTIMEYTFNECESLAQVKLPAGLETIGTGAFKKCGALKTMTLASDAAPALGSNVFENIDLSKIEDVIVKQSTGHATLLSFKRANGWKDIPNGVISEQGTKVSLIRYTAASRVEPRTGASFGEGSEYLNDECCSPYNSDTKAGEMFVINCTGIDRYAFNEYDQENKKLTGITIPEGVTSIGTKAFQGCYLMTDVTLPETLTAVDSSAFEYCKTLKIPALPASLETLGRAAFNECKAATSVDLSKCTKLKMIKEYTFSYCTVLAEVKLPEGLETIEQHAFWNIASQKITLPSSLKSLGKGVFDNCSSLAEVDLSKCTGLKTISEYCFNACTHLAEVKLPAGLETIEKNAFWHMGKDIEAEAGWKPLNLPSSLKEIGQFAFEDSRFTSLTLPAALKTVGTDVFKYSSVKTLTIEAGAVIGRKMFNDCFKLETITCKSTTPPNIIYDSLCSFAKEDGNYSLTNIKNIYVPSSKVGTYQSAPGWTWYSGKISAIQ